MYSLIAPGRGLIALSWVKICLFLMFIFERERVQVEEGQRDRETQNLKQAPGSQLSEPNMGLEPTN